MLIDGPIEAKAERSPSARRGCGTPSMLIDGPIEAAIVHHPSLTCPLDSVDAHRRPH